LLINQDSESRAPRKEQIVLRRVPSHFTFRFEGTRLYRYQSTNIGWDLENRPAGISIVCSSGTTRNIGWENRPTSIYTLESILHVTPGYTSLVWVLAPHDVTNLSPQGCVTYKDV
jgi:hypothetical protein